MSKSKGNVIAPQQVSDKMGAEILRLGTASTDYSGELSISDEILTRVVEGYPVDSAKGLPAAFVYTGVPAVFEASGFEEVARRSRTRPIYRRAVRAIRRAAP